MRKPQSMTTTAARIDLLAEALRDVLRGRSLKRAEVPLALLFQILDDLRGPVLTLWRAGYEAQAAPQTRTAVEALVEACLLFTTALPRAFA